MQAAPSTTVVRTSRTERQLVAVIVVLMALLSFVLASGGTLDPGYSQPGATFNGDFFRQQAISMLDGRLDVSYPAGEWNECFFRDNRCFGYFGIAPSVIRLAGFAVSMSTAFNPSPVIIAAGAALALWAALDLALGMAGARPAGQRLTPRSRLWLIALVGGVLGPGGLLTFLSQAKVYYEAIVLMVAGLLVCFAFVHRWFGDRRTWYLVVAIIAAVVATNSRPAALVPTFIVGVGVIAFAARDRSPESGRHALLGAALAILPSATAFGVMWMKFRALSPSYSLYYAPNLKAIEIANGGELRGLRFLPTNLVNYLRPDTLAFDWAWPWVQHAVPAEKPPVFIPPIVPQGLYTEVAASLPNIMPVALLLTVGFVILLIMGVVHSTAPERQILALLLGAAATAPVAMLANYALTTRYLGDFFPLLAVGCGAGLVALLGATQDRPVGHRLVVVGVSLSVAVTFIINLGLHQQMSIFAG